MEARGGRQQDLPLSLMAVHNSFSGVWHLRPAADLDQKSSIRCAVGMLCMLAGS